MAKQIDRTRDQAVIRAYLDSPRGARVIAAQMQIGVTTVQRILERNNIPIPALKYHSRSFKQFAYTPEEEQELVADYGRLGSARAVTMARGACYATVLRVLKRHGITPTFGKPKRQTAPEVIAEVVALTKQGVSRTELSKRFRVRHETIANWLRVAGLKGLRPGRKNVVGRWIRGDGYVNVLVPQEHRFFSMTSVSGYVMEHRLVMAEKLDRPLASYETVHHKNGQRDDNRIENLELRMGKHGKGAAFICCDCGSRNIRAETLQ